MDMWIDIDYRALLIFYNVYSPDSGDMALALQMSVISTITNVTAGNEFNSSEILNAIIL